MFVQSHFLEELRSPILVSSSFLSLDASVGFISRLVFECPLCSLCPGVMLVTSLSVSCVCCFSFQVISLNLVIIASRRKRRVRVEYGAPWGR